MIFSSPYADVLIPEVSVSELVLGRARELGDKAALIDGASGRTITYRQLAEDVQRMAAGVAIFV